MAMVGFKIKIKDLKNDNVSFLPGLMEAISEKTIHGATRVGNE